jgi:hypothetical protein
VIAALPCAAVVDRRFFTWAALWAVVSLVAFGLVSAIIPNPVFGRQIPPEPFAIAVWLLSAPLMGLVMATYTVASPVTMPVPLTMGSGTGRSARPERDGSLLGTIAGLGAFLAIGCPVCNKIALVLLGTSGAMTVYAPLQPVIGAASLALLGATLVWRMRLRVRGGACAT